MARKQTEADLTVLAAGTWGAIVEGWEIANRREVARAKAPMRLDMGKARMKMSGGSYAAGPTVPRDPTTGVPLP